MYLFVYEVSLRDRSYNRLRHRTFHGEAVQGGEMTFAKIPQLSVMNQERTVRCEQEVGERVLHIHLATVPQSGVV